jgi:putative ABC transport system permease protein
MVVAASVATAMMNLYVDVQAKLRTEFRNYGANVVAVAKEGRSLPPDAAARIASTLGSNMLPVPFSYAIARTHNGQSVVVVGTDFARTRRLNRWWNVSRWPAPAMAESGSTERVEALVGMRAAALVTPNRQPFDLSFQGRTIQVVPAGVLQTGAGEDSRIYLDESVIQHWTGVTPTTVEIAVTGSTTEIEHAISQIADLLPTADVRPVRQIVEGEANVLNKTRSTVYWAAALIIATAALCLLATLIGWVVDRRRDFAIMKALGASERMVSGFFAAEAAALGAIGSIAGFAIGLGVAAWIGRTNFDAPVVPRWELFPYILTGCIFVALLSALVPLELLRRVQPALILRGE